MTVERLVTHTERQARALAKQFPGMEPKYDRFCSTCQDSLQIGAPPCGDDHDIRELNPREQEAETVYKMAELS